MIHNLKLKLSWFKTSFLASIVVIAVGLITPLFSRLQYINTDTAVRWTLWVTAIAVIVSTCFSLMQAQSEFQKRRSEEEKQRALEYQSLVHQVNDEYQKLTAQTTNILYRLEAHTKAEYPHDGIAELLGRVIQVEADHKAMMFVLDQMWGMRSPLHQELITKNGQNS